MNKYGISTVVGGFGREMTPEESIPYTLKRTYLEHSQLRDVLSNMQFNLAVEIGCGYGRNLSILEEYADNVIGVERDNELSRVAAELNPNSKIYHGLVSDLSNEYNSSCDLVMTFTFLQHLSYSERVKTIFHINRISNKYLLLCEETDPLVTDNTTTGITVHEYANIFSKFNLIRTMPRMTERPSPNEQSGTFMLFERK